MAKFIEDIYSAQALEFYIGEYDDGAGDWNYTKVIYRGDFSIDPGDNTRDVYNGEVYKGKKSTRSTKTFEITQTEFEGWGKGLHQFEDTSGLVVKIEINPGNVTAPTDNIRYLTNWSTDKIPFDGGEVDAMSVTLSGTYDKMIDTEPADNNF